MVSKQKGSKMNAEQYAVLAVVAACDEKGIKTATVYMSVREVVRATNKRKPRKGQNREIILTIGKPNCAERQYIAMCEREGFNVPSATPVKKAYSVKKK